MYTLLYHSYKLLALFLLLMFPLFLSSQEKGYLEFSGRALKEGKPLAGAHLTVYKGSLKVTELNTSKNGKFMIDLEFGADYKVTFSASNCADMYVMIYGSKCPAEKEIFPIYDINMNFFELGKPTINYDNFKNPVTKIIYDGKKMFIDDEKHMTAFLKALYVDPDEMRKKEEEKLAAEKAEKEKDLLAKLKLAEEEKIRQEQIAVSNQKAKEEAEALKKAMEEEARLKKDKEGKNLIAMKESESKQSMVKEEIRMTLEKEQKKIKEKQNLAVKTNFENDLLKMVAENERKQKEKQFSKNKEQAENNEVVEILRQEAITKAKADEQRFNMKIRNKQAVLNSRILNQEMLTLVKNVAYNEVSGKYAGIKKFPETRNFKAKTMVGITTDTEHQTFKTVYTVTLFENGVKSVYKKEKYSWGLIYYYKNEKEIDEMLYFKELSLYNIAL